MPVIGIPERIRHFFADADSLSGRDLVCIVVSVAEPDDKPVGGREFGTESGLALPGLPPLAGVDIHYIKTHRGVIVPLVRDDIVGSVTDESPVAVPAVGSINHGMETIGNKHRLQRGKIDHNREVVLAYPLYPVLLLRRSEGLVPYPYVELSLLEVDDRRVIGRDDGRDSGHETTAVV